MCRCSWLWHYLAERSNLAISTEIFSLNSQQRKETKSSTSRATLVAANHPKRCTLLHSPAQGQSISSNSNLFVLKTGKKFKAPRKKILYLLMRTAMRSWWTWSIIRTVSSINNYSTSTNTSLSTPGKGLIRKRTRLRQLRRTITIHLWLKSLTVR